MSNLPPNITKVDNFGQIWYKQLRLIHATVWQRRASYPVIILSHGIYILLAL